MTRSRLLFPLALLLSMAPQTAVMAQADEAARLFDEGNKLFREGNFEEARVTYEAVVELGYESGALYYNLGSAYFRLDRLGRAMLNYMRAARLLPDDEEIAHSVEIVRSRTRDRFSEVPTPVWSRWWNTFTTVVGLKVLLWLGVLLWLAGFGLAAYRLWSRDTRRVTRRVVSILISAGLVLGAASIATSYSRTLAPKAVVVVDRAALREGPADTERTILSVHEGLVVDLIELESGWALLRLPNGVTGYVQSETVSAI